MRGGSAGVSGRVCCCCLRNANLHAAASGLQKAAVMRAL